MANFIKSTLSSLIHSTLLGGSGSSTNLAQSDKRSAATEPPADDAHDEFVNRKLDVGDYHLVVRKRIGAGGFSTVYRARRLSDNSVVALKRMHAGTEEERDRIRQESRIWKATGKCDYIVRFIMCAELSHDHRANDRQFTEYVIVSEYCSLGRLSDYIKTSDRMFYSPQQAIRILFQQASALDHLHNAMKPRVVHRDVKLENFLLTKQKDNRLVLKLCDFGSATDKELFPSEEWSSLYRGLVEEEAFGVTTPAYRPPELLNTYDATVLGCPMDMWALGCCFYQEALWLPHPFVDCAKLKVINADFKIPNGCDHFSTETVRRLLNPNPEKRMTSRQLLDSLNSERAVRDDLRFILAPASTIPPSMSAGSIDHVVKLTSKLWILTSASCPIVQQDCFVVDNIVLSYDWFHRNLPLVIDHALKRSYAHVLLHSAAFGRTVVAAGFVFAALKLCKQPVQFLHFLSNLLEQRGGAQEKQSIQMELSSSSRRYLDYAFEKPLHHKRMLLKQLEILPGNDAFSTEIFQVDGASGREQSIAKSPISCNWQRDCSCLLFGDVRVQVCSKGRTADVRFNTRFIPITESEICFEASDMDREPFAAEQWIDSLIVDFMFTTDDAMLVETEPGRNQPLRHLIADDREAKLLASMFESASSTCSRFFTASTSRRSYGLSARTLLDEYAAMGGRGNHAKRGGCHDAILIDTGPKEWSSETMDSRTESRGEDLISDLFETTGDAQEGSLDGHGSSANLLGDAFDIGEGDQTSMEHTDDINDLFSSRESFARSPPAAEEPTMRGQPDRFATKKQTATSPTWDPFGDLLANEMGQFSSSRSPKMSLMDLQNLKLEKEQSEDRILKRVREWASHGHHEITALLSSLSNVLPMDEQRSNWQPIAITAHSSPDQVKKCYRKALLMVHPDKNTARNLPVAEKEACRLIFIQLSEAWNRFQTSKG